MCFTFSFAVYADGSICLDILQNRWSPTYDVSAILTSIQVGIRRIFPVLVAVVTGSLSILEIEILKRHCDYEYKTVVGRQRVNIVVIVFLKVRISNFMKDSYWSVYFV